MLLPGLCYALGRTLAYVVLGVVIMTGLLARARVSQCLQRYMNEILGPILILLGLLMLGWIGSTASLTLAGERIQRRVEKSGLIWAVALGAALFALSFYPMSAGMFFAGVIPLAAKEGSRSAIPTLYGIDTALPVLVFAFLMTFAATSVGKAFNRLTAVERWIRMSAGVLFILAGL